MATATPPKLQGRRGIGVRVKVRVRVRVKG